MHDRAKLSRYLEDIGRTRLSPNFFFRDFLHSEIAAAFGVVNRPDDLDLAIEAGTRLCRELLEPLHATFGKVCVRSGYRSRELNALGHRLRLGCASNAYNYAGHIWDARDAEGRIGATATVVIPWFVDYLENGGDWRAMAWFVHDHLPYSYLCFYPRLGAFNIQWREQPERKIMSWRYPKGILTQPSMGYLFDDHAAAYVNFPPFVGRR
ncbi:hypothetical protein BSL82_09190 [Tardibacter chloracetimidivorans]|uniref:Peptidase M15 n=1 Tax=Tardibacter chloracetimidivorans TaxID=1921510 RepID=A0A1L3ZUZ8_9SPHN|nr:hypothetical protein [Tardibacter chloracetimidivorans]API59462.1 hypothetical protein BSL82_09190 [Tardibacter chloracetimidivorans]